MIHKKGGRKKGGKSASARKQQIKKGLKKNTGLLGKAARAISARQRRLDSI